MQNEKGKVKKMYILKNAWKNITRNKGRNILIGIIIVVIAAASSITLAIRESANDIVKAYQEKNKIEATIGMDRNSLMNMLRQDNASQEDMINAFNKIEGVTVEEIDKYGESDYVSDYYYTYDLFLIIFSMLFKKFFFSCMYLVPGF